MGEKEENERKELLKLQLTNINCLDLLEIFYKNGVLADNLTKLDQKTLREFGVKVGAQKRFMKEMPNFKKMQDLSKTRVEVRYLGDPTHPLPWFTTLLSPGVKSCYCLGIYKFHSLDSKGNNIYSLKINNEDRFIYKNEIGWWCIGNKIN